MPLIKWITVSRRPLINFLQILNIILSGYSRIYNLIDESQSFEGRIRPGINYHSSRNILRFLFNLPSAITPLKSSPATVFVCYSLSRQFVIFRIASL